MLHLVRRAIDPSRGMAHRSLPVTARWADMEPWWHRYPKALEQEKAALDALGHPWTIDETAQHAGRLIVRVKVPAGSEPLQLTAEYPATYPYFVPQVTLAGKVLARHQNPVGKNLCLLAREGESWQPGVDTLAALLKEQLPRILEVNAAQTSPDEVAAAEDRVGEPLSSFLPYFEECAILVPDATPTAEHHAGRLTLAVRALPGMAEYPQVSGVLRTITDMRRNPLVDFPLALSGVSKELHGFWLRLPERPQIDGAASPQGAVLSLMDSRLPEFGKAISSAKRGQIIVVGLVYPDECSWRSNADDWIFVAIRIRREAKGARAAETQQAFIRADWGGERAWLQRAPALRPLRNKSALVVGLGSLGSPLVLQLARAGIKQLSLIDCDHIQAGNTVRWALGWQFAGLYKARALAMQLTGSYPYTAVQAYNVRIGVPGAPDQGSRSDYELIRSLCGDADLMIDASANQRVSHFLADLARELGKPYLWLTTTHGAAGGVVGRILPGKTEGCWHCFLHRLGDGSIALPADSGGDEIQPGGCSQPTFIGAGIDSDEIALLASRLAISTLSAGAHEGYPDFTWDVGVADLYKEGRPIAPAWKTYDLTAHPACAACQPI